MPKDINDLAKKYPDKISFSDKGEMEGVATDEDGFIDEGFQKIDIEVEDLRLLLKFGKIQLQDAGVELVLRKTERDEEVIRIKHVLKNTKTSGKVIVPVKWIGKRIAVILLEEYAAAKEHSQERARGARG